MNRMQKAKRDVPEAVDVTAQHAIFPSTMSLLAGLIAAALTLPALSNAQAAPGPFDFFKNALKPMPVEVPQEEYDGFELRYGRVVFRPASKQSFLFSRYVKTAYNVFFT
jgi:hypothetical protein